MPIPTSSPPTVVRVERNPPRSTVTNTRKCFHRLVRSSYLLVRLTVSRGPRELRRLLLLVEHLLALAVQEEERGGVNLGQTHAVTRIDAEAAERALFRLEHHCRCAKTREAQRGGCVPSRTTGDASAGRAGESHEKCVCPRSGRGGFNFHRSQTVAFP